MNKAGGGGQGPGAGENSAPVHRPPAPLFLALLLSCVLAGCGGVGGERRRVTAEQQALIDSVTEDVAAGRDDKLYEEAAEEWRASVSAEENRALLARLRERLGRVQSRSLHTGTEREAGGRHTLVVTYQTTFERATGMETFRLLERDGRWLLAGYMVTSDVLK